MIDAERATKGRNLITQPMLAAKDAVLEELQFPAYASRKLDGIRMVTREGSGGQIVGVSRKFVLIPNRFIQRWVQQNAVANLDGEIMVRGLDGHFLEFNDVQSAVMKEDGEPDFVYMVFDYVKNDLRTPFSQRYLDLQEVVKTIASPHIQLLPQISVRSATELQAFFERSVAEGFEGAMYRKINSPYKCGRSTLREGWLIKIKLFDPAEAEIIGFNQGESNQNPEEYDAFGNVKRAHFKDGKVLKDELGSFIVKELDTGIVFDLSGKLSHNDRVQFWKNQKEYLGKVVRFKYQGRATDQGAKPRFPIFLGFRDRRDMD